MASQDATNNKTNEDTFEAFLVRHKQFVSASLAQMVIQSFSGIAFLIKTRRSMVVKYKVRVTVEDLVLAGIPKRHHQYTIKVLEPQYPFHGEIERLVDPPGTAAKLVFGRDE
jgi:hypothetical protein